MTSNDFDSLTTAQKSRIAAQSLATLPNEGRNTALMLLHDALATHKNEILKANRYDLGRADKFVSEGTMEISARERLDLGRGNKFDDMLQGILEVKNLDDPLNQVEMRTIMAGDSILERRSMAIGVILVIFESRPEVMVNVVSLCLKSGNAVILKGGKEGSYTNHAIFSVIQSAMQLAAIPKESIELVVDRHTIEHLLQQDAYIDMVIPRGGKALVSFVKQRSRIPVLSHADGICSIYLRADCAPSMAADVLVDAKTSYPAACNSVETLLVDERALSTLLPTVAKRLVAKGVQLRCDDSCKKELSMVLSPEEMAYVRDAEEKDYMTEFSSLVLAIKTIPDLGNPEEEMDIAIAHINDHSSHHTDAVLTEDRKLAKRFQHSVDSASVFWNASTRMADGKRFGFGAEIGISTNRLHARGPVGLQGLTSYRWHLDGNGLTTSS